MGKIFKAAASLLPLALGGCFATSVKGMREHTPVLVADSIRDPATITNCVSEAWVAKGMTPKAVPRANGSTVMVEIVSLYALPIMVVDADTTPTGSHVTMRQFKTIWSKANRSQVETVRACL